MPPGTVEFGLQDLPQPPSRTNLPFQLPLVCHLGYPVALEHLSRKSLVTFVTFLLHHGRTADKRTAAAVRRLTRIWPGALSAAGSSGAYGLGEWPPGRLRRLVCSWYRVLGCETLLSLSATLERENSRGRLRLQHNADGTSSLWERSSDRLVVTFRDDTRYNGRPSSLGSSRDPPSVQVESAAAVQPPPPDCVHCGAQFITPAAAMAHERLCDGMAAGSDSESVRSEPVAHSISQHQFLGYLGLVTATGGQHQSQSVEQQQRQRRRRRCWPSAELLLRLRRADFSSPLGRRMLAETRQPDGIGGGPAARLDRHCCSRAVRAPPAEFPVTWRRPSRQPGARSRLYCFTAGQRAERAAAICGSAGVSARPQALTDRVRRCSVVLRRLKSVGAPRTAARVLLPRLTEAEIAAWLDGSGGRSPPVTPDGGRRPPPARPATGGLRRRTNRQQLLRDECKAIRDADFFHLLDCDGRVTRGGRKVPQTPVMGKPVRQRSRSEGDSLAGDCDGVVRDGDPASWRKVTRSCRRRMSLLESMQGRLHAGTGATDGGSPVSLPPEGSVTASLTGRVSLRRSAARSVSPCRERSDSGVTQPAVRRATPAAGDGARRRPVVIDQLMSDECKTLRDRRFVRLLNRPSRTTRSAASSERPSPVRVWLHWPGFARDPDHQTPVKHARAAGEPRRSRAPVVRLERLFQRVAPVGAGGGGPSGTPVTPLSPGGGAVRCRRRLDPDTVDAELTARFLSRCRQQILPAAEARGEQVRPAMVAVTAPPPPSPPSPAPSPPSPPSPAPSPPSPPSGYVSVGPVPDADYCKQTANGCWPGPLKLRPRSQLRRVLSKPRMPERLMPVGVLLDTVNNNGINSFSEPEVVRNRPRQRPRKFLAEFGLSLKVDNVNSSS